MAALRPVGSRDAAFTLDVAGVSRAKGMVNEDAYLVDAPHFLFGVFDGLGATAQAGEAAALAADSIRSAFRDREPGDDCDAERAFLVRAVQSAGALIAANLDDGLTTASVVKVCERPHARATAVIAHVGDSRVYRFTRAGELEQCTLDDSEFGADWDLQRRLGEVVVPTTFKEFVYFEQRHILDRCLGSPGDDARVWEVDVDDGDLMLAMTDGVTDNLTFSEIRELMGDGQDAPDQIARRLVESAFARSQQESHGRAKVDDITAVVARVGRAVS